MYVYMCMLTSAVACQLSAQALISAVILESVMLEQLASFVLLSVFPFELHNGVGLKNVFLLCT